MYLELISRVFAIEFNFYAYLYIAETSHSFNKITLQRHTTKYITLTTTHKVYNFLMTTHVTFTTFYEILNNIPTMIMLIKLTKHVIPINNLTHFLEAIRKFSRL